jgi:tyrosinase
MTYLSTAAFDPGFWLHHMMVDRLFALWQGVNPNSYGASQSAPHATWTIPAGQVQNANSPLTPFHRNSNGDFWTTNQVRDTKVFKYTYPEFANTDGSTGAIQSQINRLYGPGATATAGSTKRSAAPEPQTFGEDMFNEIEDVVSGTVIAAVPTILASLGINLGGLGGSYDESASVTVSAGVAYTSASASAVSSKIVNAGNGTSPAYPTGTASLKGNSTPLRANNGSSYQYTCNIETPRYALNGSYSVFLFNGEPKNPDPTSWTFDENLIGPAGILAQPGMTEKNITVSMGVPLTRTLVYAYTQGKIADLTALARRRPPGPVDRPQDHPRLQGRGLRFHRRQAKVRGRDPRVVRVCASQEGHQG